MLLSLLLGSNAALLRPFGAEAAPSDVGLPLFGVTLGTAPGSNVATLATDAKAGFASVHIAWSELEPLPGVRDAAAEARADALIKSFGDRGIKVVVALGAAPAWAGKHPNGPLLAGKTADYVQFVQRMVAKYSVAPYGVHHWILFSEPDAIRDPGLATSCIGCLKVPGRGAWGDDAADYAALLRQAYPAIKQVDPNGYLLLGPLAFDWFYSNGGSYPGFNGGGIFRYDFLDNVLAELAKGGGSPAFDAVAINAYIGFAGGWEADAAKNGRRGVDVAAKVNHVKWILEKHGVSAPVVVGEAGFWSRGAVVGITDGKGNPVGDAGAEADLIPSQRAQAEYVAKVYARARDAGVGALAWFALEEPGGDADYGLVAGSAPKEAYTAYQWAATALGGAERKANAIGFSVGSGSVEAYGFTKENGYTLVAWAKPVVGMTTAQALSPTAQIAVMPGMTAYDLFGAALAPSSTDGQGWAVYALGRSPVFFRLNTPFRSQFIPLSPRNAGGG